MLHSFKQFAKTLFITAAFILAVGQSVYAQDADSTNAADTNAVIKTEKILTTADEEKGMGSLYINPAFPAAEVVSVTSCDPSHPGKAGLGDNIIIVVKNAGTLFEDAKEAGKKIILYVNNTAVKDGISERTAKGIRFFMPNEGDVTQLWNYLMSSRTEDEFFEKKVSISIGIEGLDPLPTKVDGKDGRTFTLYMVHKTWFVVCIIFLLVVYTLFIIMARRSDMLRDTGEQPATGRKPYSLARVQMGIWFLVVISSWLFLYVCLHHFDLLSESILILMGITAGTGVGGLALDTNKAKVSTTPSEGFLKDLISDHSNISLFRFQNFAWTIVLVVVFIRSVLVYLKMPEFDNTLLLLMGISSGTYIGAKVSEKRETEDGGTETPPAGDQNQPG